MVASEGAGSGLLASVDGCVGGGRLWSRFMLAVGGVGGLYGMLYNTDS